MSSSVFEGVQPAFEPGPQGGEERVPREDDVGAARGRHVRVAVARVDQDGGAVAEVLRP